MIILLLTNGPLWPIASGLPYLGPETMLPLASFVAAVMGFVLLFWKQVVNLVRRFFRFIRAKLTREPQQKNTP